MLDKLLTKIRQRSREQWVELLKGSVTDMRIWIQENGEKAALVALVLGVILVAAFKLIFTLLVVAVLIFSIIWVLAGSESSHQSSTVTHDSSSNGAASDSNDKSFHVEK